MLDTENRRSNGPGSRRPDLTPDGSEGISSSRYQAAVAELGQLALESSSLATLYKTVSTRLCQLLDLDRVAIMEVEDDCRLVLKAGIGWSSEQFGSTVAEWTEMAPQAYPPILRGPVVDESLGTPPQPYGIVPQNTPNVTSAQTVPVGKIDVPVGAIGTYSDDLRRFTSDELILLKSVAQILASAIERSRTDERIRQHSVETTILGEIARIIGSSLEIDEVYPLFVEQVARLLDFDRITVSTIDLVNNTQHSTYVSGVDVPGWGARPAKIDGRAVEAAVRARAGMIIQDENLADFERTYPFVDIGQSAGLKSMLTVPVIWNGEVISMLTLRSLSPNAYQQRDLHVAERIAAQIAGALANSKFHHDQMAFAEEQSTLAEISRIIASAVRIDEIYPRFAEAVRRLIPFDRITITTINEEFSQVMSRYSWGKDFPDSKVLVNRPLEGTLTAAVGNARTGMIVSAENILNESEDLSYLEAGLKVGLQSAMGIPLIFRGRVIGAILLRSLRADAYSYRETLLAERVAAQISGIVWNAQLQEQLEQTVRKQVLMADLSVEMIKARDLPTVLEHLHEKVAQCIQFDRFAVGMFDAEHSCLKYEYVRGIDIKGFTQGSTIYRPTGASCALWPDLMSPHFGKSLREGIDPEGFIAAFTDADLVSWLQAPLKSNDRAIGMISLRSVRPNAYSRSDLLMLERVAEQVALAIDNVKHHQHSREFGVKHALIEDMLSVINEQSDASQVFQDFNTLLRSSIPADRVVVSHIDSDFEALASEFNTSGTDERRERPGEAKLNRRLTTTVLKIRSSLVLQDALNDSPDGVADVEIARLMRQAEYRSSLSVPLKRGTVIVAVLHLYSSSPNVYSARFQSMAEEAGTLLAATVGSLHDGRPMRGTAVSVLDPTHDTDQVLKCSLAMHQLGENDVEILRSVAKGLSNAEIARQLNFAPGTIKNRLARIYKVFDVSDRAAAMAFAIRCGIVE